jgi:glycosyltransferase involved in cell wall biosynthesis
MKSIPKNNISGLAIVYNEEKNISELINNLNFVDELIIIDSFSTDKTLEIIKSFKNVKVIQNKFTDFTSQRNLALNNANCDWVLFLDADERIPEKLKLEIIEIIKKPKANDAYYFYRKFMFKGKPLNFSGWQTDKNFRLFKREKAHYINERLVHETLEVNGTIGVLKNKLIHYSYNDYKIYKSKMINYGKLRAKELYLKKTKHNFFKYIFKPIYKFAYDYFIRLGILDGQKGIVICYLNALSVAIRYRELKKIINSTSTK